jgi:formamidopyrimidine-DNA glycosylase
MPELPEVETLKRRLSEVLPGKTIAQIQVHHPKSFFGQTSDLIGTSIINVERRSKVLTFQLSNQDFLMTHLKMTGQLIVVNQNARIGGGHPNAAWVQDLPNSHTRIEYTFTDQTKLYFNDQRIFGWMRQINHDNLELALAKYGPDIISPQVTVDYLAQQFQRKNIPIKQALMDNAIVAGVGNIYASEALFATKISPFRPAKSLTKSELENLITHAQRIVLRAIDLGGTTFDGKYVNINGLAGGYQNELQVYGKTGLPCPICHRPLEKAKIAGRGTYFCANCQK